MCVCVCGAVWWHLDRSGCEAGHVHCDGLSAEEPRHFLAHLVRYVDRENILCSSVELGMHRGFIT